jgi:putative intracellular protease/amidase
MIPPVSDGSIRVLMVLTSHDQLGDSGEKTGYWLEEYAAPYFTFHDAGVRITVASPAGGRAPLDPASDTMAAQTPFTIRLKQDAAAQAVLDNTARLADMQASDFDAVFFPGGHGPMWDLTNDPVAIALIEAFTLAGKPVAAVCHAPAVLTRVFINGEPMVKGKRVAGFSDSEEEAVHHTQDVPFLLEDRLRTLGGLYERAPDWQPHVVTDGLLITGQNPASSRPAAQELLALLIPVGTTR